MPGLVGSLPPSAIRRAIAVINPATRRSAAHIVDTLRARAGDAVDLQIVFTRPDRVVGDLMAPLLTGADLVIACGGDGTVADVITGLGGRDIPVGIIPAGSTNVIARENRLPLNPARAADLIFGPHGVARLDVGLCGSRRFLHMAGAGLDSRLFAATNPALKRRVGWPAYVPAAARNLLARPVSFSATVDGATVEAVSPLVLVANGASIVHPLMPVFPGLRRDDGLLDVLIFTPRAPSEIGRTLARFLTRGLDRSPYVVHLRGREIELDSSPRIPLQLDGDLAGSLPACFGVEPGAARLIVPRSR